MDISKSNTVNMNQADNLVQSKTNNGAKNSDVKFSDELKSVKEENSKKTSDVKQESSENPKVKAENQNGSKIENEVNDGKEKNLTNAIDGLNDVFDEINKLNQKDEILQSGIKQKLINDDKKREQEDLGLIDNNINIQEQPDKFNAQMGANMSFNSNGQPFAEFVNQTNGQNKLNSSAKDLAEEKAIMSTMEENIAIANKNIAMAKTKTVENEHGIHKIDKKSNLVVDTIVSYDSIIMDKSDVEFFTNLVENGFVDIKDVTGAEKSAKVSKTLADMLLKAMNDNKPVRIDFDNNISVIIKIDRAGKISADFLPSSQVAEAYLKENLPLLRQRFDDNNIDYNELNQRQRKQDTQDNRKKGRKDE